jgi:type IV pilus assembly protein PilB
MPTLREDLIKILLESKRVSKKQLDEALELQRKRKVTLKKVLIDKKIISEKELLSLLSQQLYVPALQLAKYKFSPEVISLIPEEVAKKYNIIPVSKMGDALTVATSDPLNIFALDDLKTITRYNIDIVLSAEDEIKKAISICYRGKTTDIESILSEEEISEASKNVELLKQEAIELSEALEESQAPPIVKLVDLMLTQALRNRASDIHIEPEYNCLRIRYRIDGDLREAFELPKSKQNAVLARVKIISNLDITESRLPQDGRFKVKLDKREIDFRVSALPTSFGQKFVLRALDKSNLSVGLDQLGFSKEPLKIFKESITKPFGMILVTGPTGSGKSTTLYSILSQLNTPERNIVTIEDPVEYQVEGVTQIQVRSDIGLDFSSGLRAVLRQSPDIIMVGEIRDAETADTAVKAALTGELMLSTLHTNDAASSFTRLIDMGVEPFLVASSLIMACAQRLCRRICTKCKEEVNISSEFLKNIGFNDKITFYRGKGCAACNKTGFFGRVAILEALMINDNIREMIIKNKSSDEIKEYAIKEQGMQALRDDAFLKVKQGMITIEEAIRVTTEE